jgi:hypothetical protein
MELKNATNAKRLFNRLKPSGNYMYHSIALHLVHIMYLCVSYDSQCKQRLFPQTVKPIDLCNGEVLCFLCVTD